MDNLEELAKTRNLLEQLNIGVIRNLEKKTGVCKIEMDQRSPADRHAVLMWEQRNGCFLPEDFKNFYLTTDGFKLTWNVKMDNGPTPVGKLYINRVSQLTRIAGNVASSHVNPTLLDLEADSDNEDEATGIEKPSFDSRCKIYEMDPCDGYGRVCLVFRENKTGYIDSQELFDGKHTSELIRFGGNDPKTEVWFLDRSLRWHFLAESFMAYFRLMLMHLGLPQWQYGITDIGLSQQAQQWFNIYAPTRLELDRELLMGNGSEGQNKMPVLNLDVNKVFNKGKTDKKKPPAQTSQNQASFNKKKPIVSSAKTLATTTSTRNITASSSQISTKGTK
ncbi:tubulin polyglutamylase complex subunit 2-like isoform X1 [Mytilus edulis]|uniref:tubulin polyglutamylase complex subunit 2-like isoform X1 n=1 Tax=Mytilus edulis TaxID=6550 RepID=UPI0039EF45FC